VTAAAGWHRPAYRTEVVRIFEPLGVAGEVVPHVLSRAQAYGEGLSRYRARVFAAAAAQFARVASDDAPSALFLARVRQFAQQPPGPDWGTGHRAGGEIAIALLL
jgi:adenylate cyclase